MAQWNLWLQKHQWWSNKGVCLTTILMKYFLYGGRKRSIWKVTHRPFRRPHTFYVLHNWTSAVLSKLFLRSEVSFNNLFWVLGISKVDLLWEKYISHFQIWSWVAGACAGGPRAAGLGSPSQVRDAHRLRRRCKDTAKHFKLTHVLLICFGIESQQSFPMFQQIYHACQVLKFRSGPSLFSCHFLGKKKYLSEDSNVYQWL